MSSVSHLFGPSFLRDPFRMTPKEQAIAALVLLCRREGGHANVASEAGLDEQTIWQIVHGIKLPSGAPRGVGPKYQRLLTTRYPDWMQLGQPAAAVPVTWPIPRIPPKEWQRLTERQRGTIEDAAVAKWRELIADAEPSRKQGRGR